MRFVLIPSHSLERMTLVRIAVSLWSQNDVKALVAKVNFQLDSSITDEIWKEIESTVLEKMPQLPLPQLLKEKVSGCIKPIGSQILKWMQFHYKKYQLRVAIPAEFCWTQQGTIDRKKTVEVLVKDESLDLSTRYKLACIYGLEEDIHQFWNSMPEDLREDFLDTDSYVINEWSRIMKRRGLGKACTSYKDVFEECACEDGNKVAVENLLQKLTPQEREESLVATAKCVSVADVLCFLLSQMDEEQQMKVFKKNPFKVLGWFLQWPLQSFFIGIANCMWDFISKDVFYRLLIEIIDKVTDGCKDWSYQKLFTEFWRESPGALKSLITDEIHKSHLLSYLFCIKDKEIIRLILKNATPTVKQKLIYSDRVNYLCQCSIRDDKWDFLEFFIHECFPSENEMLKFKEEFEKCQKLKSVEDNLVKNKCKWDQLFCLSDDSICMYEKRSTDEDESTSSKRFRSLQ